ncbi:hypothetical protein BH24DEI2_BH24DEI2_13450 [soil metagenome]
MVQPVSEHYFNERHIETEVKRIVGKLETIKTNNRLKPVEHCRLLQDFEALLELKVLRQRAF